MIKLIIIILAIGTKYSIVEGLKERPYLVLESEVKYGIACKGDNDIGILFDYNRTIGEENQYGLIVSQNLPAKSRVELKFDSEATVTLADPDKAHIYEFEDKFLIIYFKKAVIFKVHVRGPATGTVPYIESIYINRFEYCNDPQTGYLDDLIAGPRPSASVGLRLPDLSCGRRKVAHIGLIVNGESTKPGDWPWHVALYRLEGTSLNYICGGTLISKTLVLTAAHCVTFRGIPVLTERMNVVLGKSTLIGGDISSVERLVHEITVHPDFNFTLLNNDIALLKLKSEVVFNDYIQPACLWSDTYLKKLPPGGELGTVVGWGFDQSHSLTNELRQSTMPAISDSNCLKSNPVFFTRMLTPQKFCAGYANGTSVCNGDSGGGFTMFVPDTSGDVSPNATGAWYVRGIVSSSVSRRDLPICDTTQYVLFTDVSKFVHWVYQYIQ